MGRPTPADPIAQLLTYRGFYGSEDHLPTEELVAMLPEPGVPYWFPIYDGTIPPQQTDRGQVIAQEDCWLLSLIASSAQAAGFVARLFDSEREIDFADGDFLNVNGFGTALRQFFLKTPVHIPIGGQLESRIINLATVSNAIQVIGHGVRPDMRKKVV
jgi:hypothetical protein